VTQRQPRRPLATDQRRALVILVIIGLLVAVTVIGIASVAVSLGLPPLIAIILALVSAAIIGLFILLNLV
jgi:lipopolysaccharide export LptBFGC system permease protein LptF